MIKFSAGYVPAREAHMIGLGLSAANLRILLDDNRPIRVRSEELHLPGVGFDLVLFAGTDRAQIEERASAMIERHLTNPDAVVPALDCKGTFYLFPLTAARPLYLLGIPSATCDNLLAGQHFSFRVRIQEGEGTSVEVLVFAGQSELDMERLFQDAGLIGPGTQVRR